MAQRSNRRFLNPLSVEVLETDFAYWEESGRIPSWPGVTDSTKAEYIGADQICHAQFSLAILRRTIHTNNER